jgi:hypothetical protein
LVSQSVERSDSKPAPSKIPQSLRSFGMTNEGFGG